ncbi:SGNH hydrolase [Mytilinidion resinicola]|uniref:SGNH hydrolase n=1 Tax=Mytilinidion resinicola TaxID=574789 RepID=A0A6A6Y4X3_9PEZI|nr:SGNH hydrolase [Mytilinidion resinicola]KAF2803074.1 SGNH hydrolase [Mytilinidion resinicola]
MESTVQLPKIVLFGDSLTDWAFNEYNAGFGWVLEEEYKGKAELTDCVCTNRYTSSMLAPNFEKIISRAKNPNAPPTLLFTIFLGANDACLPPWSGHVPLDKYEANLRAFVETILSTKAMTDTKIVLITPPPINIRESLPDSPIGSNSEDLQASLEEEKKARGYRTYMNKKQYAEKVMEIAESYVALTDRVIGLNFWKSLIDTALEQQGRLNAEDAYDENKLPGCGLPGAKEFKKGFFTDGLHFGPLAYKLLSEDLITAVLQKWPELGKYKL